MNTVMAGLAGGLGGVPWIHMPFQQRTFLASLSMSEVQACLESTNTSEDGGNQVINTFKNSIYMLGKYRTL